MNGLTKICLSPFIALVLNLSSLCAMEDDEESNKHTPLTKVMEKVDDLTKRLTLMEERVGILEGHIKVLIPKVVRGHEDIYERFLRGVLVYKPNRENDERKVEMRIAELDTPLEGTFNLSQFGVDDVLSISTGYRKRKNPENASKIEVWICPRFLIEKKIAGSASHFSDIMDRWNADTAPVGIFFTWGDWDDLSWYEYGVELKWEDYNVENSLFRITSPAGTRVTYPLPLKQYHDYLDQRNYLEHVLRHFMFVF